MVMHELCSSTVSVCEMLLADYYYGFEAYFRYILLIYDYMQKLRKNI